MALQRQRSGEIGSGREVDHAARLRRGIDGGLQSFGVESLASGRRAEVMHVEDSLGAAPLAFRRPMRWSPTPLLPSKLRETNVGSLLVSCLDTPKHR